MQVVDYAYLLQHRRQQKVDPFPAVYQDGRYYRIAKEPDDEEEGAIDRRRKPGDLDLRQHLHHAEAREARIERSQDARANKVAVVDLETCASIGRLNPAKARAEYPGPPIEVPGPNVLNQMNSTRFLISSES